MTTDELKIGTFKYIYKDGKITCMAFGYVDDDADEPAWHWRWSTKKPENVRYVLRQYPSLEKDGEIVIY